MAKGLYMKNVKKSPYKYGNKLKNNNHLNSITLCYAQRKYCWKLCL